MFTPGIILEGGSVDFNGKGTVLTTESCLLNTNRNPQLSKAQIESYLHEYFGVEQIIWLKAGIQGDDTDGHIDDITRFVNEDTVVTVTEQNPHDPNYAVLQENLKRLKAARLPNGKPLNVIELPMPASLVMDNERLPALYANFYICNHSVIVPTYRDEHTDQKALDLIGSFFPDRKTVGIDSTHIAWGLGSFHCLSQQEPRV